MQKEPFEPKKLAPLRILEILKEGSDEAHPMTQTEIAERLERDFGIVLERKAVARNLQMLGDAGYAVVSCGRKRGVYLTSRPFEAEELQMLVDSVLFSRHISQNDANALVKKLCSVDAVAPPVFLRAEHGIGEGNAGKGCVCVRRSALRGDRRQKTGVLFVQRIRKRQGPAPCLGNAAVCQSVPSCRGGRSLLSDRQC